MIQLVTDGTATASLEKIFSLLRTTSLKGIEFDIWDNSDRINLKVFGRYAGLFTALSPYGAILTQDDDCLVDLSCIAHAYQPGVVTCNMPLNRRAEYSDGIALVGWGAIFDRNLTRVFNLYLKHFPIDDLFLTECDRVFTGLNKVKMIDVPFTHLPNAETPDRLHKRPDHWDRLKEIRERIYFVKRAEGMA